MNADRKLISEEEIRLMVSRVAQQINDDYGDEPVIVICILTGAFIFTADLVRELDMPVTVDFMKVSSYEGDTSTGRLNVIKDLSCDIRDKNVIIVEDIVDTGNTLFRLRKMLADRGPKSLRICTAFDKPSRRVADIEPDYNGITVPDEFIVGYGLDYNELYRNIKDIRIIGD